MNSVDTSTVVSYSERGSKAYEDPMNKNFLYGDITVRFLDQVTFADGCTEVLDIGCGTGFVFDELGEQFGVRAMHGIGIEPAAGMLEIAREKYTDDPRFTFDSGSFENIPLSDRSVDKIISTLALHWVKSLEVAAVELNRVLRDGGSVDILMIAKDDGAVFKRAIVEVQKKHLTFAQIMKTATLVQRATEKDIHAAFAVFTDRFEIDVRKFNDVVYGTFDEHMKWWRARSSPVIAEVVDKDQFIEDLRVELEKFGTDKGIPFDAGYFWIALKGK